jgi:hypothetical protein
MEHMQAFTRAASILGVFIVGCLTVTMGGTQIKAVIPNGTTQAYVAKTADRSDRECRRLRYHLQGLTTAPRSPACTPPTADSSHHHRC